MSDISVVEVIVQPSIATVEVIGPVITSAPQGPQGLKGDTVFIQPTAPTGQTTNYAWFDTSGGNLTLWIEEGL